MGDSLIGENCPFGEMHWVLANFHILTRQEGDLRIRFSEPKVGVYRIEAATIKAVRFAANDIFANLSLGH